MTFSNIKYCSSLHQRVPTGYMPGITEFCSPEPARLDLFEMKLTKSFLSSPLIG